VPCPLFLSEIPSLRPCISLSAAHRLVLRCPKTFYFLRSTL
jgi:hypothetical protein